MSIQLQVPVNKKLNVEIASSVLNLVKQQGALVRGDQKYIDIQVKDVKSGETRVERVNVGVIRNWVSKNTIITGTNKGFGDLFEKAKNDYRKAKVAQENKALQQRARRNLVQLLDDDVQSDSGFIGITSKRDPKTGKRIEVQRYKQKFIGTDPIKFREKAKATLTVLEKLDPAFKKDAENTVNVNLSFLSLSEKRQEMIKLGKIKTQ